MRNTRIFFIILFMAAALLFGVGCGKTTTAPAESPAEQPEQVDEPVAIDESRDAEGVDGYTLAEIANHNTPEDCWFAIDGKVYNVTDYDDRHPGGAAVYAGCGLDATELFETRPMGSGTPHSENARAFLPNFEIGLLEM